MIPGMSPISLIVAALVVIFVVVIFAKLLKREPKREQIICPGCGKTMDKGLRRYCPFCKYEITKY
jgi:predicted amidophosphoribosyltransferase